MLCSSCFFLLVVLVLVLATGIGVGLGIAIGVNLSLALVGGGGCGVGVDGTYPCLRTKSPSLGGWWYPPMPPHEGNRI